MSTKKVLITGAAGFIGLRLARRHAMRGDRLTLVDNFFRGESDTEWRELLAHRGVEFIQSDLTMAGSWKHLPNDYDYVYHLAAVNGTELFYRIPHEVLRTNILATIHALDWFKGNRVAGKMLLTSSNEAYAGALEAFGQLPIPTPEGVPLVIADVNNPRWAYAGSKLVAEQLFIHYANTFGFRMVIVRPHNFYGPRAGYNHVVPQLIERIVKRTDPFPIYGGEETRSFCYIEDGVEAMLGVMASSKTDGAIYHIGSSRETTINDLADALFTVSGWRPKLVRAEPSPAGSVKRRLPDTGKIREVTGWQARTSLEDGLQATYAWYRRHYS